MKFTVRSKRKIIGYLTLIALLALLLSDKLRGFVSDSAELELNAFINDLISSPDSYFLSRPTIISGGSEPHNEASFAQEPSVAELLDPWFDRSQTRALIVQRDGKIVYQRYTDDADFGRNINALSIAKNIVALVIGIAIDEGKVQSEYDFVSKYIPELSHSSAATITLRDLLRHTSGLESNFDDVKSTLAGGSLPRPLSDISFLGRRTFKYDNINYHLLSIVLERIYQKPLNKLIEDKIWQPLGLEQSSIISTTGYCCMFATARSWLAIGNLYLSKGGSIVSPKWIDKMIDDHLIPEWFFVQATGKSTNNSYGYHIYGGLKTLPDTFWIEGMGLQLIMINPVSDTLIIRLGGIPSKFSVGSNRGDASLIEPLLKVLK